jgi:DHA2 family multidrug resistance protein
MLRSSRWRKPSPIAASPMACRSQTFVRMREQIHSNLIGLHIDSFAGITADRLALYRNALGAHATDLAATAARATDLLAATAARQAAVLSYIDGFLAAALGAYVCLMLVAILPAPLSQKSS